MSTGAQFLEGYVMDCDGIVSSEHVPNIIATLEGPGKSCSLIFTLREDAIGVGSSTTCQEPLTGSTKCQNS